MKFQSLRFICHLDFGYCDFFMFSELENIVFMDKQLNLAVGYRSVAAFALLIILEDAHKFLLVKIDCGASLD